MKVAAYIGVSTTKESQNESLENQKFLITEYIKSKGYDLFNVYLDRETATGSKVRPELERMIKDAKEKKFDLIVAKDMSRLTRDTFKISTFMELFYDYDIHIVTLDNFINTVKETNLNDAILFGYLGEKESTNLSSRIKGGLKSRAMQGFFKGSIAPYGYYVENGKLKVRDDDTPSIVKRIFSDYLNGHGLESIARKLYVENQATPATIANKANKSNMWHGSTIKLILENRNYTGDLCQCKTIKPTIKSLKRKKVEKKDYVIVENTHEAIISHETFELVQNLIISRSKKVGSYRKSEHLFSGITFCHDCGRGMHYRKNRHGYICGKYDKIGPKGCKQHFIRESELLNIIQKDLEQVVSQIDINIQKIYDSKIAKKIKILTKQLPNLEDAFAKMKIRRVNMLNNLSENIIDKSSYDLFVESLELETTKLQEKHQKITNEINSYKTFDVEQLKTLKKDLLGIKTLNKSTLLKLVSRIEIKENGDVKIFYRFPRLLELF